MTTIAANINIMIGWRADHVTIWTQEFSFMLPQRAIYHISQSIKMDYIKKT